MKTITYGVAGLIDWQAIIPTGQAHLSVHFTGGALTKYGVTPAEFTTSDPVTQHIIEHSHYYRSGKIYTLRVHNSISKSPVSHSPAGLEAKTAKDARSVKSEKPSEGVVEVPCFRDAVEYLQDKYNIPSIRLLNREALDRVAAQLGIEIKIKQA